ncbi:phospholipase B1, membrane-associated-like [Plectropomus leopardus]|uniref:phospholipase B1, membrane-associated-like n=1 Tax=Plectropomus leopardus TaxID=160734 RepID=UPI001C4B1372|nr:phospholipase B1, membrane-associated-like [Plectropomus leopardus]
MCFSDIIKLFNPKLLGAAPGKTVHGMQAHISETGFNLAVTGHNTFNLPGQTRHLIDTLRGYEGLNFEEDWKLLTILMGMNDICDYCKDKALFSVDNFIHYITVSLEMLMNEVPRMIVNVVQILPMHTLREVQKPTPGCLLQRSFCSCLIEPEARSPELQELVEVNREFQKRLESLLFSDRFFRDDFAVVLQPFLQHADPPRLPNGKIDMTFFTHDCFHFTIKGHEELAKGLWNNMFQPEGGKMIVSSFSDPISLICPPMEHPYIFTRPIAARSAQPPLPSGALSQAAVLLLLLLLVGLACLGLL